MTDPTIGDLNSSSTPKSPNQGPQHPQHSQNLKPPFETQAWLSQQKDRMNSNNNVLNKSENKIKPSQTSSVLAPMIDHTLLKADVTAAQIKDLCQQAINHGFATVCVNSSHIELAAQMLKNQIPIPIAVVGFPLGACLTSTKVFETTAAIQAGAREIDMVIQIGALKAGDDLFVENDISAVVNAAQPYPVKVIIETCLLSDDQKIKACLLAKKAGAAFVKTSTGFGSSGASEHDIKLMRQTVGPQMGVKASGGIRTYEVAKKMIQAGANRIGASASVAMVAEEKVALGSAESTQPAGESK